MNPNEWTGNRGMRWALLAVVCSVALCGWAWTRARTIPPIPPAVPSGGIVAGALDLPPKAPEINVLAAVGADLFSPERKAPAKRYRVPGEAELVIPPEPAKPVVLGTGVNLDGRSFATLTFESSRVLFVYVGEYVGIYQVKSIDRGKVVFTTAAGKELEILAPRPGS